jgi:GT2 family glycosyltransferase
VSNLFAVIVTWNGEDCIAKCLHSLLNADIPMQIVVVDNASSDQTVKIVQTICPNMIIFQLTQNLGFGKANNIGIKYAYDHDAEHVLLINQDAYVDVNTVSTLVALQQINPKSAIISPLHLDGTGCHLDRLFANHIGKTASIRELMSDALVRREIADIYHVDFINAAIWLMSRDCITRVGLFNPAFDTYREDNEYTDRVRYHGFNVSLAPACHAYHERTQDPRPENLTVARYRLMVNATTQYRILRRVPGAWFNIASAMSCILLSSPPINTSFVQVIMMKLDLVRRLLSNLPAMMHYRKRAYQGTQCFFEDAELDRRYYVLS